MEEQKLRKRKQKALTDGNKDQLASLCSDLGDFYNQTGRYEDAIIEYQEASKIYTKMGRQVDAAKAHRMVAEMNMIISEFDQALSQANIYLRIVQKAENIVEEQRAFATIGRTHLLLGQSLGDMRSALKPLKNAEKAFIQSLLICKKLSGQVNKTELLDMQARLYLNIGVVKEHMGEYEESIMYIDKAIKLSKENDLFELLHLCYISASLLYFYKKEDTKSALKNVNLALEVSERLSNRTKKECETLITKSEIMIKVGDFHSAKQILHKAYKINTPDENDRSSVEKSLKIVASLCYTLDKLVTTDTTDYTTRKQLYEKLGDGCCSLQNYPKAIEYYLKSLEYIESSTNDKKELVPIYVSLYQTYKDNKEYDEALKYLWKELELNEDEPLEAFTTLCNIGEVYELQSKPFWSIEEIYRRATNEAKKVNSKKLEKIVLIRLYKLQMKHNMHTLADSLREQAKEEGLDLDTESEDESPTNSENIVPDVGDEICLADLTDSGSDMENDSKNGTITTNARRRRGTNFAIKRNNKGETQLHQACIAGNLILVRRLIEQGHTVNIRDHAGWLPLHEVCNHGYRDIAEYLLDNGALSAINDKGGVNCDGITPLYDACSNGYLEVAELLLDRGAKATLKTDFGDTPLNILDKWRRTAELDAASDALYERVREKLIQQLGTTTDISSISPSKLISLQKLQSFAYEDSDNSCEALQTHSTAVRCNANISDDEDFLNKEEGLNILRDFNSLRTLISPHKKLSEAKQEYKDVMEQVKHPNRTAASSGSSVCSYKKRSAFLEPDEIADDWLDDDLGPNKKKRKYFSDNDIFNKEDRIREKNSGDSLFEISPKENSTTESKNSVSIDTSKESFLTLFKKVGNKTVTNSRNRRSSSSSSSRQNSKQQSSLFDSGFSRHRSIDDVLLSDNSCDSNQHEPDSTTNVIPFNYQSQSENVGSQMPVLSASLPSIISFKIKIEDELLLVPVDRKKLNDVNIRWLAEEASRRYYNLIGLRPTLRLMTSDGFAFEETDSISTALDQSMITTKVLDWKITPLAQRYDEICNQMNFGVDHTIKSILEKSQTSNKLSFSDLSLTPDLSKPIFKALFNQSVLIELDLSNNCLQDDGCKQIASALSSLRQLKILNLSGNAITVHGLEHINSFMITKTTCLPELEELNLSFNPLGDRSIRTLEKFCQHLVQLKRLNLSSCSLSDLKDYNLKFSELTSFNISFNPLNSSCIKYLLENLNSSRMENLNLSFLKIEQNSITLGGKLIEFLENGTCERFRSLNISSCNLTDSDIYNIALNLSKAKQFETINLSANERLTMLSLEYILNRLEFLKKLSMQQCLEVVNGTNLKNIHITRDEELPGLIVLSVRKSLDHFSDAMNAIVNFWSLYGGDHCKHLIRNNHIYLYKNDDFLDNSFKM